MLTAANSTRKASGRAEAGPVLASHVEVHNEAVARNLRARRGLADELGNEQATAALLGLERTRNLHVDGRAVALTELPPARLDAGTGSADTTVRSPMPGNVVSVHVSDGATVEEGAPLLAVEAMKMQHTLTAPIAGTVEMAVQVPDQVAVDQELAVVQPVEPS